MYAWAGLELENREFSCIQLADEELVHHCLENHRPAWNEFFRRFIPHIKKAIKKQLRVSGHLDLSRDQDVLWEVHKDIVIKLFDRGWLRKCHDLSGIRPWLKEVASNQTIDWLRKRHSRKTLPERVTDLTNVSLHSPTRMDSELLLIDTIEDDLPHSSELDHFLENLLERLGQLDNKKASWVLRLSFVSQLPLSSEELDELTRFSGSPRAEVASCLVDVIARLEKTVQRKDWAAGRAILLWYEIRRLEAAIFHKVKVKTFDDDPEILEIRNLIQSKAKKREEYVKQSQVLCRPSNLEIARLVGMPAEKADQISSILVRARRLLLEKMAG